MDEVQKIDTDKTALEYFYLANKAVDDGEDQLAINFFSTALSKEPQNSEFGRAYVKSMCKAGLLEEASSFAVKFADETGDLNFYLEWSRIPDMICDWSESELRRKRIVEKFPGHRIALNAIVERIMPSIEMLNFEQAADLIKENWSQIVATAIAPRQITEALSQLNMFERLEVFTRKCIEVYGDEVDAVNFTNSLKRSAKAIKNIKMMSEYFRDYNIISLGQNCLPYMIACRWGLNLHAASGKVTPFDLGAFFGDTAPDAISDDFKRFRDKSNFLTIHDRRGIPSVIEKNTRVPFYHERGKSITDDNLDIFFRRISDQVSNYLKLMKRDPKLFVFCRCGSGSLERLIIALSDHLENWSCNLLIIDVLDDEYQTVANHPRIRYVKAPYPKDYNWNWMGDYLSDRGYAFEHYISNLIRSQIVAITFEI
jgi:hypothetical protein